MSVSSPNFGFLSVHDPLLVRYAALAERYFTDDPNTTLVKLRQFVETLADTAAAYHGLRVRSDLSLNDALRLLRDQGVFDYQISDLLHGIKNAGNEAAHQHADSHQVALHQLRMAREVGVWFHRSYKDPGYKPGPFVPPPDPSAANATLHAELDRLRQEQARQRAKLDSLALSAKEAKERVAELQLRNQQAFADLAAAEELIEESEAQRQAEVQRYQAKLDALQAEATQATPQQAAAAVHQAYAAAEAIELDEQATRRNIDAQLRAAGWEADSDNLRYAQGFRPVKGRNLAIAEWKTESGPADYVLFVGLTAVGVVEAKKASVDVSSTLEQAKRYARTLVFDGDSEPPPGGPWQGEFRVPYVFATNGRPFLEQLRTKSGIWFRDLRRPQNPSRPLLAWRSPEGLAADLEKDIDAAHERLKTEPIDIAELRYYQREAIEAVEHAIEQGRDRILVAMATGTGKTRTVIGLCYRLLKTQRFRRVLFLVDRTSLGEQAANAFKDARMQTARTFDDIFDMKELDDVAPEPETRLHFATVQGMVRRVLMADDPDSVPTVDTYDCIVIDESHRGYNLDAEMSDAELGYRDQADYVSKYRRVLDYFDAVRIGLTATPAAHTVEIFGHPAYEYGYKKAVVDGFLVDHDPASRIVTKLARDGIHFVKGEGVDHLNTRTQSIERHAMPDQVDLDVAKFNQAVITRPFNEVVCEQLVTEHLDWDTPEKTLIFAANNDHADMVVDILRQKFRDQDPGFNDDYVVKITGSVDRPLEQIRRFRNERKPSIVVTVDLLTTGIDIPSICTLVFLRRVASRILYDQMLGRATRLCKDLHGPGQDKEAFKIIDAVDLYSALKDYTDMQPVVIRPNFTFAQLVEELGLVQDSETLHGILDQLIVKLQRKAHRLDGPAREALKTLAGTPLDVLLHRLRNGTPEEAAAFFAERPRLVEQLDKTVSGGRLIPIAKGQDEYLETIDAFPKGKDPGDYLEEFGKYLAEHINDLPALTVVTQRPRDLTRQQLKELRLALAQDGFGERALQTAYAKASNQDIAASIMGFIRQKALGEGLVPYDQRVQQAVKGLLASRAWNRKQREWLERIGKQLAKEYVVDREALDSGRFKQKGGYRRLNGIFDGKLDAVLGELHEGIWEQTG